MTTEPIDPYVRGVEYGRHIVLQQVGIFLRHQAGMQPPPVRELIDLLAVFVEADQFRWHDRPVWLPEEDE